MDIKLRGGHLPFLGLKRGFVAEVFMFIFQLIFSYTCNDRSLSSLNYLS